VVCCTVFRGNGAPEIVAHSLVQSAAPTGQLWCAAWEPPIVMLIRCIVVLWAWVVLAKGCVRMWHVVQSLGALGRSRLEAYLSLLIMMRYVIIHTATPFNSFFNS
jgi:hypothetical protein